MADGTSASSILGYFGTEAYYRGELFEAGQVGGVATGLKDSSMVSETIILYIIKHRMLLSVKSFLRHEMRAMQIGI